ncbi:phage tail protein [Pyxidicoccus xibeiensis]|uniref:phage tail protein n=1 Tax=Pyxidicoccus xibeiensis TaxID=2906759 RepID=UPI0020A80530|nr:phage tail protein [Pyxidicoccus xibeiensis]MCP3137365.1 phage tail protein [Pyxidicoccus xibeiensis]
MSDPKEELVVAPFTAFNFAVEIDIPGVGPKACEAAFAECDGLEMTMDVKTIREGGNNARQIRLAGALSYGQLTLKRGMTANDDLWFWFELMQTRPRMRASAQVVVFAPDRERTERARFVLSRCLPVKLKAPPLNAKDGMVAIEELQLAYESLTRKPVSGGA